MISRRSLLPCVCVLCLGFPPLFSSFARDQFSVQQSVDGGVMLPPADKAEEYASFLSESIRQHLDDEWIEQDCHRGIGEEAARLYLAAFQKV